MIVIASDHAGFELKENLKKWLFKKEIYVYDVGAYVLDGDDSYVDYAKNAVRYFTKNCDVNEDVLLLICGSGVGMSIVANRNTKIRAVLAYDKIQAEQGKAHNNCNCLCLGARNTSPLSAKHILETFLSTKFLGGKHKKRIDSI